jgi:hypothetical protein
MFLFYLFYGFITSEHKEDFREGGTKSPRPYLCRASMIAGQPRIDSFYEYNGHYYLLNTLIIIGGSWGALLLLPT